MSQFLFSINRLPKISYQILRNFRMIFVASGKNPQIAMNCWFQWACNLANIFIFSSVVYTFMYHHLKTSTRNKFCRWWNAYQWNVVSVPISLDFFSGLEIMFQIKSNQSVRQGRKCPSCNVISKQSFLDYFFLLDV